MSKRALFLGFDLSTTGLGAGVRSDDGTEDSVSLPQRGATQWNGQPAFWLQAVPGLVDDALGALAARGWTFPPGGTLSFSVRQHDMALLDRRGELLAPALSWQCAVAEEQVRTLRQQGAESAVGRIEARFILPKLLWALEQAPGLRDLLGAVCTTGDEIAYRLTGQLRLSTSDALSNGLLDQDTKRLAVDTLQRAGLPSAWFPLPVASGAVVGVIPPIGGEGDWASVRTRLAGWNVAAGLGDNHAGAVGCGLTDAETVVISAGSSGTVVRTAERSATLAGQAASFEFYDRRLLLMMLPDCAVWYNRFLERHGYTGENIPHREINAAAAAVEHCNYPLAPPAAARGAEDPPGWEALSWGERVAATQFSIAREMLQRVRGILGEITSPAPAIRRFVLTGGLGQAVVFQQAMAAGLGELRPGCPLLVSARTDDLAFETATYGALINAALQGDVSRLPAIVEEWCPLRPAPEIPPPRRRMFVDRLRREGAA